MPRRARRSPHRTGRSAGSSRSHDHALMASGSAMSTLRARGGLAPTRTALPNGAIVIAKEAGATPAVTINLTVRAGSVSDPPDAPGTVFLLSRLLDRGTATRLGDDIAEELDSRGIALAITVNRHAIT